MRIGWSTSHGEFIISDHYYFSKLLREVRERGAVVEEVGRFSDLSGYDVVVFNYPEKPFSAREAEEIARWAREGKRVIFAGYYKNEDGVADVINTALRNLNIRLRGDIVMDEKSNHDGDPLFVLATRSRWGRRVLMPCTASVQGGSPVVTTEGGSPLAAVLEVGRGEVYVLGTCVFWDNYSIGLYDNMEFSTGILNII
jgi:hypothetical protein